MKLVFYYHFIQDISGIVLLIYTTIRTHFMSMEVFHFHGIISERRTSYIYIYIYHESYCMVICCLLCVKGLLAIQLTAAISKLHPPHCAKESITCIGPTGGQIAFLLAGFILMIIGAGGIRPCNLAFGADQFDPETESGKRGVNSFFNWYFFTFTFAQMISLTLIVYVQSNVSWPIGLGIPAILMLISCLVYYMGTKLYVKVKATGSPMTSVARVIVVAVKKRKLKPVDQPWLSLFNYIPPKSINSKLSYTDQFR